MGQYCSGCSLELFNEDFGDLAGITSDYDDEIGVYAKVVCEGCGVIIVNSLGERVDKRPGKPPKPSKLAPANKITGKRKDGTDSQPRQSTGPPSAEKLIKKRSKNRAKS